MSISRPHKVLIAAMSVALLAVLGWAGYLSFQNLIWKQAAIGYAQQSAILEANGLFRKNKLWLYKMDGKCDEAHFSGQHDGPFEIWIVFYEPAAGLLTALLLSSGLKRLMHRCENCNPTLRNIGRIWV